MEFLAQIDLSAHTLLAALLVPFIFFLYRTKLRSNALYARRGDSLFLFCLVVLCAALVLRLFALDAEEVRQQLLITVLHLLPLVQSIFQLYFSRSSDGSSSELSSASHSQPQNSQIEKISWDDLIISSDLRQELVSIIDLLKNPEKAEQYGIEVPKGILFNGPPGTGKTTIAKVVANEAGLAFFSLKLDEIISKWVGESEKNLSELFHAANAAAPAVLFIDEIDAIGKQRSGSGGQEHREGFLNHLLQLMDGVIKTKGLYIIAATNRADLVDSALKRPGRLNKVIELGLPDAHARKQLFELYLAKLNIEDSVNIDVLSQAADGKSPAVIREICNQAGLNAFKRESASGNRTGIVTRADIEQALAEFL